MGFYHLFWGFLFLFDFNINGFDILPDFIGYLLFYLGLVKLERRSEHFHKAKNMSIILIVLSVMGLIISLFPLTSSVFNVLFSLVVLILNLSMVFHICQGISELAGRRGLRQFQIKTQQRWRWYLMVIPAIFIAILIALLLPVTALVLAILLIICSFVIHILMMLLMKDAEHHLHH